ncbi:MAG: hypothetical protein PHE67_04935, partial [Campylobacterales bacterium]|nr:hypothetical protein [Campylobacterales bacterium]
HSIDKEPLRAIELMEHFSSHGFILRTLQECGHYALLTSSEKESASEAFVADYFYACCFVLCEKLRDEGINRAVFELNFLHFSPTFTPKSNVKINHEAMVRNLLKPKIPKESFGESEEGAFFKIILDSVTVVEMKGKSIKTLRKKCYDTLLKMILDGKLPQ